MQTGTFWNFLFILFLLWVWFSKFCNIILYLKVELRSWPEATIFDDGHLGVGPGSHK